VARGFWLFKSEPDSFSINDLISSDEQTTPWDGVRNYQARNLLRDEVQPGDGVLFYHSSVSPPGIVGICSIVRGGYPDPSARDPRSEYYDPKSSDQNPIWYAVDVQFERKFEEMLSLTAIKQTSGLENMMVTRRGARLSIQPVTPSEWNIILNLVGGEK